MPNITTNSTYCQDRRSFSTSFFRNDPNIPGVIGIFAFYGAIMFIGILTTVLMKKRNRKSGNLVPERDQAMLAGRTIGKFVGTLTLGATKLGGGGILGTVEQIFNPIGGVVWMQAPLFYQVGNILAIPFALTIKKRGYNNVLDLYETRFGKIHTIFIFVIVGLVDIFLASSGLVAVGSSLSVIIGVNYIWAVIMSAAVATLYTAIGGFYSVAYTDVVQIALIFIGIVVATPFAWRNEAVEDVIVTANSENSWLGHLGGLEISVYTDLAVNFIVGGIAWPVYYQRVSALNAGNKGIAVMTVFAGVMVLVLIVPLFWLGGIAASTDWNATGYREFGEIPVPSCDYSLALPMIMRFLTPAPVGIIGLCALSAAAMSTIDSLLHHTSSLFANNIYVPVRNALTNHCAQNNKAKDVEIVWIMRFATITFGIIIALLSIYVSSIYGLFALCGNFLAVLLFPQFLCALYLPFTNIWGAVVGFWSSLLLVLLSGEPLLNMPAIIKFPFYTVQQMFPYRTLIIVIHLILLMGISALARLCFGPDNPKWFTVHLMNSITESDRSVMTERVESEFVEQEENIHLDMTDPDNISRQGITNELFEENTPPMRENQFDENIPMQTLGNEEDKNLSHMKNDVVNFQPANSKGTASLEHEYEQSIRF